MRCRNDNIFCWENVSLSRPGWLTWFQCLKVFYGYTVWRLECFATVSWPGNENKISVFGIWKGCIWLGKERCLPSWKRNVTIHVSLIISVFILKFFFTILIILNLPPDLQCPSNFSIWLNVPWWSTKCPHFTSKNRNITLHNIYTYINPWPTAMPWV